MLRKLLACLALLTGLAAVGTPAQASFIEVLGAQLETGEITEDAAKKQRCACAERQRQQRARGERVQPCEPKRPVTIYIPTVQFGPDRAFE